MAKTKMGMWMTDARGKSGGHVITKNRQGQAVRTKVTPVNRRSNSQQNARSRFTGFSQAWAGLTATQRSAWNNAAVDAKRTNIFGDSYSPTGKNYYMIVNQNLALISIASVSSPPTQSSPTNLTSLTVGTNTSAAQTLVFAASPVAAGTKLLIQATRPLSAGVDSAGAQYRDIKIVAAAATTPIDSFTSYTAVFGTPVVGKKIFFRAIPIDSSSGTRGTALQASGITA
jgi:hypothetical protein